MEYINISDTRLLSISQNVYVFFAFFFSFQTKKGPTYWQTGEECFSAMIYDHMQKRRKTVSFKNDNQLLLLRVSSRANRFTLSCCYCGINSRYLFSLVFNVIKFVVFMHLHICIYLNNVVSEIGHVKNFSFLLVPWNSV